MMSTKTKKIQLACVPLVALLAAAMQPCLRAQQTQYLNVARTFANATHANTSPGTGDGGPALAATFSNLIDYVSSDNSGNVYVVDFTNNVVRRIDAATGIITTVAGGATTVCNPTNSAIGDGCPATQATLARPSAARVYKGDLYIADASNQRIRVVSGSTGIITTFAGTGTAAAPAAYGKDKLQTNVKNPQDLLFDAKGNLFVLATGGAAVVERIDAVTGIVTQYAGLGTLATTPKGDGGPATQAVLTTPAGMTMDGSGNLFISETGNLDVREVNATTGIITTYAGGATTVCTGAADTAGDGCPANQATFANPSHMTTDAAGNLYIADLTGYRVRKVAPPVGGAMYGVITSVYGVGTSAGSAQAEGLYAQATPGNPVAVDFTLSGDMLVVDRAISSIRIVLPGGTFMTPALTGVATTQTVYANTASPGATAGAFSLAGNGADFKVGVTTCATSTFVTGSVCSAPVTFQPTLADVRATPILFTDAASNAVRQALTGVGIAPVGSIFPGTTNTIAGTGAAGNSGDGAAATSALLRGPAAVAVDRNNNIYVADTANNEVREFTAGGVIVRIAGTGASGSSGDGAAATAATLSGPAGVAVDGAGNVYIADTGNNKIRYVDGQTGIISSLAGTGTAGYTGDGSAAAGASLSGPTALALSRSGALYIADTGNNTVREVALRNGYIRTILGNGVAGNAGDGLLGPGQLNSPAGLAVDNNGTLYVADTGNHTLRKLPSSQVLSTIAGVRSGYNGDGPAVSTLLNTPTALAVDAASNLYLADTGNQRIRLLSGGQITTIGGSSSGYSGNGQDSLVATFASPKGLALDASENVIVADTGNNAVRKIASTVSTASFGTVNPQAQSAPQNFQLLDSGNGALAVASVVIPAGFKQVASSGSDCGSTAFSLAVGGGCNLNLLFAPATTGKYSGSVVVTDNAEGQASATQQISLSGTSTYVFTPSFTLPATVTAGVNQSFTVTVQNPTMTYTRTITFTSSDPQAVLPANYTYTTADANSHTFTVQFRTAGIQTLTVTDTSDPTITATSSTTVVAGAGVTIVPFQGTPQSTGLGTAFAVPLQAQVLDAYKNPVLTAQVTFTAPTVGAHASFASGNTATVNAIVGVATAPTLTADNITGTYTVLATTPGVATPAAFTLTNTSSIAASFLITPAAPVVGTLLPGQASTQTLTITPSGGFYATIALSCATSSPSTTCSFSNTSVPGTDGTPSTVQLTFQSTGPSRTGSLPLWSVMTALLLLLPLRTLRRRKGLTLVAFVLFGVVLASLAGCGDGLGPNTQPSQVNVTVTGTAGALTSSTAVTYYIGGK